MQENAYSTWYCLGSSARHSICRSPGIDPAACTMVASGPTVSFSAPSTSVCAGSGPWSEVVRLVDDRVPPVQVLGALGRVGGIDPVPGQARVSASRPSRASATSITPECFAASKRGDVQVHEPHVRVLERGPRRGGEVAVPGADPDDHVGVAGQRIGDRRAGRPDPADGLRVVPADAALAGLGVGDRDAGGRRRSRRSASVASL